MLQFCYKHDVADKHAAPIVKWAGGKARLLPELVARMPARFGRYYEPFAGGAALFFRVAPERAVLGDMNFDLVWMYDAVKHHAADIALRLQEHRRLHCEAHYRTTRESWNSRGLQRGGASRAAMFLYLNRTCFNGLWRVNKLGEFNVPMGRYVDPLAGMAERLRTAAPVLARAELRYGDYRMTVANAAPGDFVYFDPPYDPVTRTASFTAYQAGGFGQEDQRHLAEFARDLRRRGVHVLLSNSDTLFIRSLYPDFQIDAVQLGRAINSKASKRGKVGEVIIRGEP